MREGSYESDINGNLDEYLHSTINMYALLLHFSFF